MRLVTWNCNSLSARKELVGLYLDEEKPDVLCLQELKLETDKVPRELFESRGYHVAVHGQRSWNGVLIASKFPLRDIEVGLPLADLGEARLIAATLDAPGTGSAIGPLRVVNLYCPQGQSVESEKFAYKLGFYDGLIAWAERARAAYASLVVCGDLNVAPGDDDVWDTKQFVDTPSFHPLEHQRLARLLALGFHDAVRPHIKPRTFTFWDYRGGAFRFDQGLRIDHVLVSKSLVPHVSEAWVARPWRKKKGELTPSDHAPVGIRLG